MADEIKLKLDILNPKGDDGIDRIISKIDELIASMKTGGGAQLKGKASPGRPKKEEDVDTKAAKELNDEIGAVQFKLSGAVKNIGKAFTVMKEGIGMVASAYTEMVKASINALTRGAEKFVTSSSLRFDREVANMMQMTGQSATEAQATMRSLEMLGLSFEDLQRGMLTDAQSTAFANLRDAELTKLNQIAETGGDAFATIQEVQIELKQMVYTFKDSFLLMLVENKDVVDQVVAGVRELLPVVIQIVQGIMPLFATLLGILPQLLQSVMPIFQVLLQLITTILPPFASMLTIVMGLIQTLIPVIGIIMNILNVILPLLTQMIGILGTGLGGLIQMLVPIINSLINALLPIVELLMVLINALLPLVFAILGPLIPIISVIADVIRIILAVLTPILSLLINLMLPSLRILTFLLNVLGMALGWVGKAISFVVDGFMWISKGISDFFGTLMGWVNKLLGWLGLSKAEKVVDSVQAHNVLPGGGVDPFAGLGTSMGSTNNNQQSTVNNNYNYGNSNNDANTGTTVNSPAVVKLNLGGYGS